MVTYSAIQTGTTSWLISWTSDQSSPTYRCYLDGVLVSTQATNTYTLKIDSNAPVPLFEVLDTPTAVPQPGFPSYLVFGWNLDTNANTYLVQQWSGSAYVTIDTIAPDLTQAWQTYSTGILADETTAQWQIVPVDAAGNQGTAVVFIALVVRPPDIPSPAYTYNGSSLKTVTLS